MEIPFGYCHCGCGKKTNICTMTAKRMGYVAGLPYPYLLNHHKRKSSELVDAKPFKVDGVYCRLIPLTQGLYTIVNASRYEELSRHKWHARKNDNGIGYYAQRNSYQDANGNRHQIQMSRFIFGIPDDDPNRIDHRNMNTLDNRDDNLRYATPEQNGWNQGLSKRNTSGFKGVSFDKSCNKWITYLRYGGKQHYVGRFASAYEAHIAWREVAKIHHGDFARWI